MENLIRLSDDVDSDGVYRLFVPVVPFSVVHAGAVISPSVPLYLCSSPKKDFCKKTKKIHEAEDHIESF